MSDIRVMILEDDRLVAASLKRMLEKLGYSVTAVVFDADSALFELERNLPDLAILDINLGGEMSGIDVAKIIHERYHIPFIYLTAHADRVTIGEAKQTEPSGYIVKPFDQSDILANLEIGLHNHAQRQKNQYPEPQWETLNDYLIEPLTRREVDVLKLIYEGKTNAQMSEELFVSVNTVRSHLGRLYQKLEANSRTEALARVRVLIQRDL